MSLYGANTFDLVMGDVHDKKEMNRSINAIPSPFPRPINSVVQKLQITSLKEAIIIYKILFADKIPKEDSEEEIHKYILDVMKKEDEMDLCERYVCSIYLVMNKHLLNEEIKKDMVEEEFHLSVVNWLAEGRGTLEEDMADNFSLKYFNIYIALLFNIISLLEILPIKVGDILEFNFYSKLFKLNNFVKLYKNININISLSFLINKIDQLLGKWKIQIDCYHLAETIQNFTAEKSKNKFFLGKKTKRNIFVVTKEKEDTEADTDSCSEIVEKAKKLGGLFFRKSKTEKKKVCFNLENNQIAYFDKDNEVSKTFCAESF